jgi:hypothetical protein
MFLLNNVKFLAHIQRTIGDTQYPAGWFLDPAEREKIGVIEVPDIPQPDTSIYHTTENPDGSWTAIPKTEAEIAQEQKDRIPTVLSPAQVRLVLKQFGLLSQVEAAIAASTDDALKIEWEFRVEFVRNSPTLLAMASALNISDAQLDEMFTIGATL